MRRALKFLVMMRSTRRSSCRDWNVFDYDYKRFTVKKIENAFWESNVNDCRWANVWKRNHVVLKSQVVEENSFLEFLETKSLFSVYSSRIYSYLSMNHLTKLVIAIAP